MTFTTITVGRGRAIHLAEGNRTLCGAEYRNIGRTSTRRTSGPVTCKHCLATPAGAAYKP